MAAARKKTDEAPAEEAMPKVQQLRRLKEDILTVQVEGITPVIPHRWSEKAIQMMQDKQGGVAGAARAKREPKNPEEEAYASCYWLNDEPALPAVAFKAAMVGACRFYEGVTMVMAKQLFLVVGEGDDQLVPLKGVPKMRTDMPRNATGVADIRYRYQVWPWAATLKIRYLPDMTDVETVLALLDTGGRGGVGDWRPSAPKSATGTFGQFRVVAPAVAES